MSKKPIWILVAFIANLALLPFVVAPEGRAQQRGDLLSSTVARRLPPKHGKLVRTVLRKFAGIA